MSSVKVSTVLTNFSLNRFSARFRSVLLDMEAQEVADLEFVCNDDSLLGEIRSVVSPFEYQCFLESIPKTIQLNSRINNPSISFGPTTLTIPTPTVNNVPVAPVLIDIAYLIDATGNSGYYFFRIHDSLGDHFANLQRRLPGATLRVAVIIYRDFTERPDRHFECLGFDTNLGSVVTFVRSATTIGGGDEAEDTIGGLDIVPRLNWQSENHRFLYHITDAPCHGREFHDSRGTDDYPDGNPDGLHPRDILPRLIDQKILYFFAGLRNRTDIMIRRFNQIMVEWSQANSHIQHSQDDIKKGFVTVLKNTTQTTVLSNFEDAVVDRVMLHR
jgi:hypothetical protein